MDLIRLNCRKTLLNFLECLSEVGNENNTASQLFIETSISSLLSLITDVVDYNNYGYQRIHPLMISEDIEERIDSIICDLELDSNSRASTEYTLKCIFLCHPSLSSASAIIKYIEFVSNSVKKNVRRQNLCVSHYIGFVPFYSKAILRLIHKKLAPSNIYPECYSVNLHWVPIDESSLSMEIRNTFLDFHVYKEESSLQLVANSLYWLLKFTNSSNIPIISIGSAAVTVLEYLTLCIKENKSVSSELKPFNWNHLFETDENYNKDGSINYCKHDLLTNTLDYTQCYLKLSENEKNNAQNLEVNSEYPMGFDQVIIIDRRCDLVTPFATPFSYHALLDFIFGAQKTYIDIPTEKVQSDIPEESPFWKLPLFGDPLFTILKDLRLKDVGIYLHQKANELQSLYQEKEKLKDISSIGDFVRKLKGKQHEQGTLAKHVNIATYLNEYFTKDYQTLNRLQLEDSIMSGSSQSVSSVVKGLSTKLTEAISFKGTEETPLEELLDQENIPIEEIYRILCLSCMTENGFKNKKAFEQLKKHIVSVFGFDEMFRLNILERVGLFKIDQSTRPHWQFIKNLLNLFVDEVKSENDTSNVYSGYAPISTRLVEMLCKELYNEDFENNETLKEALNHIWGPSVKLVPSTVTSKVHNSCLVVFVGGVTYGEIATLRKLQSIINKEIFVATTEIINHKSFFESFKRPENSKRHEILKKVRSICGWHQDTFPGSQPVSLNKQKLESCIGRNLYVACEKTDGIRLLLYAASRRVFLIDRNQQINMVNMTLPSSYWDTVFDIKKMNKAEGSSIIQDNYNCINNELLNLDIKRDDHVRYFQQNTLLDGELVKDLVETDGEKRYVLRYLVYDCISVERDDTIKVLPLLERLKYAFLKVIVPKCKYDENRAVIFPDETPPFELFLKDFFEVDEVPAILNFSSRLPHPSDGIIFTPVHLPYIPGTCPQLLKWKPPHLNTADFAAMFHAESESYDSRVFLELLVGIRGVRASVGCFCAPKGDIYNQLVDQFKLYRISGQILECYYDEDIIYSRPIKSEDGNIIWDKPFTTVQGGWVVERVRSDKTSPNDINTVNRVFESIRDGINSEVLINTINLYKSSGKRAVLEFCSVPDYVSKCREKQKH
ncbi:Sec1-family protein [Cryptosporidium felis]|nr:Sec1-family protein [Cryptosporidium felis]